MSQDDARPNWVSSPKLSFCGEVVCAGNYLKASNYDASCRKYGVLSRVPGRAVYGLLMRWESSGFRISHRYNQLIRAMFQFREIATEKKVNSAGSD